MRQVHCIFVILHRALPSECVVVASILSLHRVLVVADVVARANPSAAGLLGGHVGVHQWPHAVVVERVWLDEVDDVESVLLACLRVGYTEVVPLSVAPRVVVWLQDEIVLVLVDLDGSAKIAAFKSGLKEQSVVVGPLRHVEGRDLTIRCLSLLVW